MKKLIRLSIVRIIALALVFGLTCTANCIAKEKTIKLRLHNPAPSTHHWAYRVFDPWAKFVEEKSNGRVEIQNFHGGALGKPKDVWEGTIGGMWDFSLWVPAYNYEKFVGSLICELPFLFPDSATASHIMRSFIEDWTMNEFKEVKVAAFNTTDLYGLWSKKDVVKMEDFQGMKIRMPGRGWKEVLQTWGATPVSISVPDCYMAMERGTIDALVYGPTGAKGFRFQEVSDYILKMNAQTVLFAVIMNKESWNRLPDDIKLLFYNELFPELERLLVRTYVIGVNEVWDEVNKMGKLREPSPQLMSDFRKSAKPAWDAWIEKANAKGYPAEKMLDDLKRRLREVGASID